LPAIIKINDDHNHKIRSTEALSFLKPSKECRIQFENYFDDGLGKLKLPIELFILIF